MPDPLNYRPSQHDALGDMSIEHEPHLRPQAFEPAPEGALPALNIDDEDSRLISTVWDEPALSPHLAGAPAASEITYARWLADNIARTSFVKSWLMVLFIALASGPWAVLGAFWGTGQSIFSILVLVSIAPAVEELMKNSAALYVAEKRPYLFRNPVQILLCGMFAGLSFAALENLMYLYVYIPGAPPGLRLWRWTVCVALHVVCAMIGSIGVMKVWRDAHRRNAWPQATLAAPYLFTATILHGLYNATAIVLERLELLPW